MSMFACQMSEDVSEGKGLIILVCSELNKAGFWSNLMFPRLGRPLFVLTWHHYIQEQIIRISRSLRTLHCILLKTWKCPGSLNCTLGISQHLQDITSMAHLLRKFGACLVASPSPIMLPINLFLQLFFSPDSTPFSSFFKLVIYWLKGSQVHLTNIWFE